MFMFSQPDYLVSLPHHSELNEAQGFLVSVLGSQVRSIVAGGFLRDLILGRPIKDIDVFVNADDVSDIQLLVQLEDLGIDGRVVVSNEAIEYLEFTDVASVIEATHPSFLYPFQIIRMARNAETPERMVERLDLGPCQVGMDITGAVWATRQFLQDTARAEFTITRPEAGDRNRSIKRFDRLVQKYPGWKLVG